jgi:hypothetical protein
VNHRPFAALSHPNGDGFHQTTAACGAIPGLIVQMNAAKASRAVVALARPAAFSGNECAAIQAREPVGITNVQAGVFVRQAGLTFRKSFTGQSRRFLILQALSLFFDAPKGAVRAREGAKV